MRQKRVPPRRTVLRLRQLRRARELTQEALGKRVGLKKTTICSIEQGRRQPSFDKAKLIAAEFGVSIEDLFGQVDIPG